MKQEEEEKEGEDDEIEEKKKININNVFVQVQKTSSKPDWLARVSIDKTASLMRKNYTYTGLVASPSQPTYAAATRSS